MDYGERRDAVSRRSRNELPLTDGLIAPVDIDAMRSFGLWSELCHVDAVASWSNARWFTTTYARRANSEQWTATRNAVSLSILSQ